jgi:hypothetical protein
VKLVAVLTATHVLPLLAGTSAQVPMMVPLVNVAGLVLAFTVPVIAELVRVTTSPDALVIVNENVPPVIWSAELNSRLVKDPAGWGVLVPKQVPAFRSSKFEILSAPLPLKEN